MRRIFEDVRRDWNNRLGRNAFFGGEFSDSDAHLKIAVLPVVKIETL
jgi:predicted component of type VI protein secretion system